MGDNISISNVQLTGTVAIGTKSSANVSGSQSISCGCQKKGDFQELSNELKKNKVSEEDIKSLHSAISEDNNSEEVKNGNFGPNVNAWLKKMVAKAIDTSWQVNIGMAGSILASALSKFYGWPI